MTRLWLTGLLGFTFALLSCGDGSSTSDERRAAHTQMNALSTALGLYYLENRRLPESLEALTEMSSERDEAFIRSVPLDPWGNDYVLMHLGGRKYAILSYGPDGEEGTEDDITWPERPE